MKQLVQCSALVLASLWLAGFSVLMRAALMNMSSPLYNAFCMEQTPEHQQGTASSFLNIAWQVGWSVGPYISGVVQERYGFSPPPEDPAETDVVSLEHVRTAADELEMGFQGGEGPRFVLPHEAAVTYRVGAEDGSEFAFETFCDHGIIF